LKGRLINARAVQLGYVSGGKKQEGNVCGWLSPHGFHGVANRVDKQIADYIKYHTDNSFPEPIFQTELISFLKHQAITFDVENGKTFKVLIAQPKTPKGVFVMFRDFSGVLNIMESSDGPIMLWNKTLVARCMDRLAKQGYVVVLVDSINSQRMSWEDRASIGYIKSIKPLFSYLKREFEAPIWSVGHGPGGFTAINTAIHLTDVEALILISPIDRSKDDQTDLKNAFLDLELDQVRVPTFIVAHTKDSSGMSGQRAAKTIHRALVNSPHVTVEVLSRGNPNSRLGSKWRKIPHFFVGRSDIVVESIVNFTDLNL
jgi:dienelactone hydrolase